MDATAARWVPPPGAEEEQQAGQSTSSSSSTAAPPPPPRLCFPNTLAGGAKVPFVPLKPGRVTWYACGPTVYDSAHMGHARAYVSFDIVRRVLEDWFGLDVHLVMNVTDVDDKIIARARRGVVLETYLKSGLGADGRSYGSSPPTAAEVKRDASRAVALALERQERRLKRAQEAARAEKGGGEGNKKASGGDGSSGAAATETEAGASSPAAVPAPPPPPPPLDRRLAKELAESVSVEELKADQLRQASAKLAALVAEEEEEADLLAAVLGAAGDALAEHLDSDCGLGARVSSDPAVFRRHAARYEAEFLRDMEALRVRPPSVLTRVSEYMEEIVAYVARIVESGFGYVVSPPSSSDADAAPCDVYFDVAAFKAAGFPYGRLRPEAAAAGAPGDEAAEPAASSAPAPSANGDNGDSSGATTNVATSKRSPADFALWKAAKPGEPHWPSPWGRGRPGWHIECSAMACSVLGGAIDVHSGGEDLAFPHHENEIAQADAFYSRMGTGSGGEGEGVGSCVGCRCSGRGAAAAAPSPSSPSGYHRQQWVNYWLHAGHLSIDGLKMSKSLKNFVTIREALAAATPAQLRILFASSRWDRPVTYSAAAAEEARRKEGALKRLFATAAAAKRRRSVKSGGGGGGAGGGEVGGQEPARWDARDAAFEAAVEAARDAAHAAFCDGVDSPTALEAVLTLAREAQRYVASCEQPPQQGSSSAAAASAPGAGGSASPPSLEPRQPRSLLLSRAASVATRILGALGISSCGAGGDEVGLGGERELSAAGSRAVDAVVALRAAARGAAKRAAAAAAKKGASGAEVAAAASEFASALRAAASAAEADARAQLGVELLLPSEEGEGGNKKAWAPLPKAAVVAGESSKKEGAADGDEESEDDDLQASDDPTAAPFLDALTDMLSAVRNAAAEAAKASEEAGAGDEASASSAAAASAAATAVASASSALMKAADSCRDGALASSGVRLEDDADGVGSFWSADAPEALAAEASARDAAAAAARARKAAAAAASALRELEKLEKAQQAPTAAEALKDKYSKFDEATGNPTHAADGSELDERAKGKAAKEAEKKRKARQPYEEAVAADPDALAKARAREVDAREAAAEAAEVAAAAEEAAREAAARAKRMGKKRS